MTRVDSSFAALIPTETVSNIIARLEVAEVGSRELDALVEVAVRAVEAGRTGLAREHWAKWRASSSGLVGDPHTQYASAPATTSLDAALALAERVVAPASLLDIEGSWAPSDKGVWPAWSIRWYPGGDRSDPKSWHATVASAATPALALCAAILRAASSTSEAAAEMGTETPLGGVVSSKTSPTKAQEGAG